MTVYDDVIEWITGDEWSGEIKKIQVVVNYVVDDLWFDRDDPYYMRIWGWNIHAHGGNNKPNAVFDVPLIGGNIVTSMKVHLRKRGSGLWTAAEWAIIVNDVKVMPLAYKSNLWTDAGWQINFGSNYVKCKRGPISVDNLILAGLAKLIESIFNPKDDEPDQ